MEYVIVDQENGSLNLACGKFNSAKEPYSDDDVTVFFTQNEAALVAAAICCFGDKDELRVVEADAFFEWYDSCSPMCSGVEPIE